MKVDKYVADLIERLGVKEAEQSINKAIEHHKKIYEYHKSDKSLTTIKFFKNAKEVLIKTKGND